MFWVYVLLSLKDQGLYIGQTGDLDLRLRDHKYGKVKLTKSRRPLKLVYWEQVESREEALIKEKEWKSTGGRRRLRGIIENRLDKNIKE